MFLTYVVRVANYRKFVIDVHTQLCYTIKQFTRNIIDCNTERSLDAWRRRKPKRGESRKDSNEQM